MALKTYLLAPNFALEPDGPIRLGNVIADPFRPTKPLNTSSPNPTTSTHIDYDSSFSREDKSVVRHGIWAKFLHLSSTKTGSGTSNDVLTQYVMDSLETIRIKDDPTDEEAAALVKQPEIQAAMKAGIFGSAPVYMVSGIKVAKGFKMTTQVARTRKQQTKAGAQITSEVGIGVEVERSHTNTAQDTLRAGNDIIFAYQLHIIAQEKWWRSRVSTDIYTPRSAFLSQNDHATPQQEIIIDAVTTKQLMSAAEENEDDSVRAVTVLDEGEAYVCITFDG